MALAQSFKDTFANHADKENSATYANITTKKPSFLIKKHPKAAIKPIIKNTIQPSLEYVETHIFQNTKLNIVSQNNKDSGLAKKPIPSKVKKTLVFDKEPKLFNGEFEEANLYKDKYSNLHKGRYAHLPKEISKETILPEINSKHTTLLNHWKGENVMGTKRDHIVDVYQLDQQNKGKERRHIRKFSENDMYKKPETIKDKEIDTKEQANETIRAYAGDIVEALMEKDAKKELSYCLEKHSISSNLRAKMVDWMVEVMSSYNCTDQTFFMAIYIMDTFLQKSEIVYTGNDLHLIGVTSMFMAAKFEEIYPMRLSVVHDKIAHKKLSMEEIIMKEGEILKVLGFNIVPVTTFDIVANVLFQINLKETMDKELYEYLQKVCIFLTKANAHDYQLISQYNNSQLAACTLFVAFKVIEQLDGGFPITTMMSKVCDILVIDDEVLYDCASKVLLLAKTFETIYPNFKNLKKFHFVGTPKERTILGELQNNINKAAC